MDNNDSVGVEGRQLLDLCQTLQEYIVIRKIMSADFSKPKILLQNDGVGIGILVLKMLLQDNPLIPCITSSILAPAQKNDMEGFAIWDIAAKNSHGIPLLFGIKKELHLNLVQIV